MLSKGKKQGVQQNWKKRTKTKQKRNKVKLTQSLKLFIIHKIQKKQL